MLGESFLRLLEIFSCFCRFDKRITAFAEDKFRRDGIDVKTGSMVVKVSEKEICTKEMKNGQISSMPYGMAVWSTGIGTRPIVMDFMKQIGQVCFT
jgi:NADH:ubiquinone reductase (non-electrogenic)